MFMCGNFLELSFVFVFLQVKAVGLLLWDAVVSHLQLLESDYFGLEYTNHYEDEVCTLYNELDASLFRLIFHKLTGANV